MTYMFVKAHRLGASDIKIYGRDKDGKKHSFVEKNFKPYFYVKDNNGNLIAYDGTRVRRIEVAEPSQIAKLKRTFEKHYEADIPYTRRYLVDKGITSGFTVDNGEIKSAEPPMIEPRISIIDIEVESDVMVSPEDPKRPISSITIYDSYTENFYTFHSFQAERLRPEPNWFVNGYENESIMLSVFLKWLKNLEPDILTGWYIVGTKLYGEGGFDIPYLLNRLDLLGFQKPDFQGTNVVDCKPMFQKGFSYASEIQKPSSWKLKDVAEQAGYNFTAPTEFSEAVKSADTLIKYNKQDVDIIRWLEWESPVRGMIKFHWQLKQITGVNDLSETLSSMVMIDTLYLREAKKAGIILDSKPESKGLEESFEGALVIQPVKGIHENVAVFDFSRYYPSIIMAFNISPEGKGLFPKLCSRLIRERQEVDTEMQKYEPNTTEWINLELKSFAFKVLTNTIYGVMGNEKFRMYRRDAAETVTRLGRDGLKAASEFISSLGLQVIYGDTDSLMVKIPPAEKDVVGFARSVEAKLNGAISEHFKTDGIKVKLERIFGRVMFTGAKKRYAARVVWEKGKQTDYIKYAGIEYVRTDQAKVTKEVQENLIKFLLRGESKEKVIDYVKSVVSTFKTRDLDDVALYKHISKSMDSYTANVPHVRGSIYANTYLGENIRSGMTVKMVWVKRVSGAPPTDVVCYTDKSKLDGRIEIDYDRMLDATVRSKVEDILDVLGISWEGIFSVSLEDLV